MCSLQQHLTHNLLKYDVICYEYIQSLQMCTSLGAELQQATVLVLGYHAFAYTKQFYLCDYKLKGQFIV